MNDKLMEELNQSNISVSKNGVKRKIRKDYEV
jgi:hypothetical protein